MSCTRYMDCALALYFTDDCAIKMHCSITVNAICKNSVTQLSLNHYLKAVIQSSYVKCICRGYIDTKTVKHH